MNCPSCQGRLNCLDSRQTGAAKTPENQHRKRRYACPKCGLRFTSVEFLVPPGETGMVRCSQPDKFMRQVRRVTDLSNLLTEIVTLIHARVGADCGRARAAYHARSTTEDGTVPIRIVAGET